jgi:hypothetical protein
MLNLHLFPRLRPRDVRLCENGTGPDAALSELLTVASGVPAAAPVDDGVHSRPALKVNAGFPWRRKER